MAVTLAQPIVFAGGSGTSIAFSLGSAPTPGNQILIGLAGNDFALAPSGFTALFANSATSNAAVFAAVRTAQAGDTAGPYSYTGFGAGYDGGGFIAELAGAAIPTVFVDGNATWTLATTSEVATGSLATTAGSLIFALFNIATGSTTIAQSGSDAISTGFALLYHNALATSSTGKSYQLVGSRSDGSAGTANPVATAPNVTTATGQQSQFTIVVPAGAAGAIGNADNPAGAIANGGVAGGTIGNSRPGVA